MSITCLIKCDLIALGKIIAAKKLLNSDGDSY